MSKSSLKEQLLVKIQEAKTRESGLLMEISKCNKHRDILETELVGERELIKKYQEDLAWLEYQTEFS